jgi:ParB family transcriptional regulator, chromosome partitioning protein
MPPEDKPMNDNARPSRLGRGLAALIGDMASVEGVRHAESSGGVKRLPVDFVVANAANPRREFVADALEELTTSIREKGVMQPLLVRPTRDPNQFEIIAGERRWRAAQKAGLHEIPVIVREVDDKEALELAIIENVQRVDLNPLEEAQGYGQLIDQFSYTQQDLAQVIGKSRSHVANTLRLLRLPQDVRDMLSRGELTAGHARTLITAEDPATLARRIVDGGLSVREAEALSQQRNGGATKKKPSGDKPHKDPDTLALERRLSDALGLAVAIDHKGDGGRLEIRYRTLEQLDGVCLKLTGAPN